MEMLEESKDEDSRESELSGIRVRPFAIGTSAIPLSPSGPCSRRSGFWTWSATLTFRDYGRVARQNEAAGAAEWVRSAVVIFYSQTNYGSQGGHPYDPSTKNHAGRTMFTSLLCRTVTVYSAADVA
jgi:hypothetical protein